MALVIAALVFAGFGMTYWFPMAAGTFHPAPPVVHVHGWVYSAWMILLVCAGRGVVRIVLDAERSVSVPCSQDLAPTRAACTIGRWH